MQVSTARFEFSHGRRPRGAGIWAFFFDGHTEVGAAQWFAGSYDEAARQAVAFAKANGHTRVEVGS